jgi:rhodanese-related sulfurtransferase
MRSKRSLPARKIPVNSRVFIFSPENLRQAWGLFIFSAIFAILFNAFYADGIELKSKPSKPAGLQPILNNPVPSPSYTGWKKPTPKIPKAQPTPPTETSDNFPRVSLMGAKDRFDKKGSVFIDARKPEEYKEAHIPGALNCFGNELNRYAPLLLPQLPDKNREIIAYCHGGDCDLALQVAQLLLQQGYTQVRIFADGWPAWKKADYPVSQGETP